MTSVSLIVGPVLLTLKVEEEGSREEAGGGMAVVVVVTMTVHRTSSSILCHLYELNEDQGGKAAAMGAGEGRTLLLTPD